MKIDRLLAITNYLLCHGKTSATKLANEFEVSARTIIRDMETLDQAGIPVKSTFGVDGGYEILNTYVVDKQIINYDDYNNILLALKGFLSAYKGKAAQQTLDKLKTMYDDKSNVVKLDFSVAAENNDINAKINILENAIRNEVSVEFEYTNTEGIFKHKKVEPARLEFKWYNWYLVAFVKKYNEYRMFKLVRMGEIKLLNCKNSVDHTKKDIVIKDSRSTLNVKLRGNSKIKSRCIEYLNGKIIKEYENGDFDFFFTVPENEVYWYGVVLSFGNNAKVLEPQKVIDKISKICNEIIKNYE